MEIIHSGWFPDITKELCKAAASLIGHCFRANFKKHGKMGREMVEAERNPYTYKTVIANVIIIIILIKHEYVQEHEHYNKVTV